MTINSIIVYFPDDKLRLTSILFLPNELRWRFNSEDDGISYFHTEISNIVLGAWQQHPALLQASEEKALTAQSSTEIVDVAYSINVNSNRKHVAIGEFKRCLIAQRQWQEKNLSNPQRAFSQELRG